MISIRKIFTILDLNFNKNKHLSFINSKLEIFISLKFKKKKLNFKFINNKKYLSNFFSITYFFLIF